MAVVNLDTAARLDIICRRGDSFSLAVEFDNDLDAGGTWTMQVRTSEDDNVVGSPFEDGFSVSRNDSDNKKLDITNDAANMDLAAGLYVYDVQHSDDRSPAAITTYLFGTFEIREDVTITA